MKKKLLSLILSICMVISYATLLPQGILNNSTNISASALSNGDYEYVELDDGTAAISGYSGSAKTLSLPQKLGGKTVTAISEEAFKSKPIKSVTLSSSIRSIGDEAFASCKSLEKVQIPEGKLKTIGSYAFFDCTSLKSITIPKCVEEIDGWFTLGYDAQRNKIENFILYCYEGTAGEKYGMEYHINYVLLDRSEPEGWKECGAAKIENYHAITQTTKLYPNAKNNGVYWVDNNVFYFASAKDGKTTIIRNFLDDYEHIDGVYVCGNKMYLAGYYSYDDSFEPFYIVYDLDSRTQLKRIATDNSAVSIAADSKGNVFIGNYVNITMYNSSGKSVATFTPTDYFSRVNDYYGANPRYDVVGYDETKGLLFFECSRPIKDLTWVINYNVVECIAVKNNKLTYMPNCALRISNIFGTQHTLSAEVIGGSFLATANDHVTVFDLSAVDTSNTDSTLPITMQKERKNLESGEDDYNVLGWDPNRVSDRASIGVRTVYNPSTDSILMYGNSNKIYEYDKYGNKLTEYNTIAHVFSMERIGDQIAVGYCNCSNGYYFQLLDWKSMYPKKVSITGSTHSLKVGQALKLNASTDSALKIAIKWTSNDAKIATVSSDGKVYATGIGTTTITAASQNGANAKFTITVTKNAALMSPDIQIKSTGAKSNNASENDYEIWSDVNRSYLYEDSSKNLWRAEYIGSKITVEKYSAGASKLLEKYSVTPELSLFGGIYFSTDYNYVVTGQTNPNASDNVEVLRITRYTKDWKKKDHVSVKGANTSTPFRAGSCRFTEINGKIYIHTCHEMYPDEDGTCHQANMTFVLDKAKMKVIKSQYGVSNLSTGYVSHSLDQFAANDGTFVYRVDHSQGLNLTMNGLLLSTNGITISLVKDGNELTNVEVYVPIRTGNTVSNYTGIALGDFNISKESLIVAYTRDINSSPDQRNVYVSITDNNTIISKQVQLTNFTKDTTTRAGTPQLIKVSDYLFAVLWEEYDKQKNTYCVKAMLIDGQGNKCSAEGKLNARLSDCEPILCSDGCIRWYVTNNSSPVFYSIQPFEIGTLHEHNFSKSEITKQPTCTQDGVRTYTCSVCGKTKTETIKATGHKWSEWTVTKQATETSKGTLTRKCSQCGKTETENYVYNSRLAGDNRFGTAAVISQTSYTTAKTVILANGMNYADALAGVPLAKKLDAPILLTNTKSLDVSTADEIKRLKAEKVIILGGEGAVSADVEKSLQNMGLTTERIAGKTRFGTATAIAEKLNDNPTEVFFVYGLNYADALSVSPIAALKNAPIIYLTQDGELNEDTAAYLEKIKGKVKNAYVIGGEGVISKSMMNKAIDALGLKSAKRIYGSSRYSTCIEVNLAFASVLTGKEICIATGTNFPDALAGGVLAARKAVPLILASEVLGSWEDELIKSRKPNMFYVFGGKSVVKTSYLKEAAYAALEI